MKKSSNILAAAIAAIGLLSVGSASAAGYPVARWQLVQSAVPPLGFQLYCLKNPQQCRASGQSSLQATDTVMATLAKVNSSVNLQIKPRNDVVGDTWTVDPASGYGDCEDYAMTKRSHLIRMGLPASALRMAYVETRWGEDHAVLVVRTNAGEFVLDNLTSAILPIQRTGLRLKSISSANPTQWVRS
jgi:predicted transglutaminase-like cysteine proteinase